MINEVMIMMAPVPVILKVVNEEEEDDDDEDDDEDVDDDDGCFDAETLALGLSTQPKISRQRLLPV